MSSHNLELQKTPSALLDGIVTLAPLVASMAKSDEPEKVKNEFKNEYLKLIDNNDELNVSRVGNRLVFLLGVTFLNKNNGNRKAPHAIIEDAIALYNELAMQNFKDLHDVPMENALWGIELAARIDHILTEEKFSRIQIESLQVEIVDAFNKTVDVIPQRSKWEEERTRNAISKDIAERFSAVFGSIQSIDDLSHHIQKFHDSIEAYSELIVNFGRLQTKLSGI